MQCSGFLKKIFFDSNITYEFMKVFWNLFASHLVKHFFFLTMDSSKPDCASECLLFTNESEKKEKIFLNQIWKTFSVS